MQDNTVQIDNRDEIVVDLFALVRRVWKELRRHALIILLLAALIGAGCYFGAGARYNPVYTANAAFTINRVSGLKFKTGNEKNSTINRIGVLFPYMIRSSAMKSVVMDDLGYADSADFNIEISSTGGGGANVIGLSVKSSDPQLAYDAVQSILRNHWVVTEPSIGEVEISLISQSGVPSSPSGRPSGKKPAAGGILFVLIASLIFAAIKCVYDRKIQTGEALARALDTELLGTVPRVKCARGKRPASINSADCPVEMTDAARTICLRLEKTAKECDAKTILVTSTLSAEGKTTAAANLALVLAAHQQKVLLVEGNLRNPSILAALDQPQAEKGIADVLAGSCEPEKAMISCQGDANLTLLPAGTVSGIGAQSGSGAQSGLPTTLWSNPEAEQLFKEWRDRFDYILIDSSAAASCSESGLIARLADGCIYLGQEDRVQPGDVRKGAAAVTAAGCRILGCVFTADH